MNAILNEMKWPSLILVNGPSSAGKTTLCRALQAAIEQPYLVVGFDDFIFMSATRYYRGADTAQQSETDAWTALGAELVKTSPPGSPVSVTARFGPVFRHLLDAMAPAVRTLIDRGNPVIFDHVLHDRLMYESYLAASAGLDVFTGGVTCPLDVLEMRERVRGDRVLGRARGLSEVAHTFCAYDTMIDTGITTPAACVKSVLGALISSRQVRDRLGAQ